MMPREGVIMATASVSREIRGSVGRRGANARSDVKVVQELLNRSVEVMVPYRSLVVDGRSGPRTEEAIMHYQRRAVGLRQPDGRVDPGGQTIRALRGTAKARLSGPATRKGLVLSGAHKLNDVDAVLREKVLAFAAKFGPIHVTSGRRSLRKQAELMAKMDNHSLHMYGEDTYYIVQIKALPKPRSADAVHKILVRAHRNGKGSRISWHVVGKAVDISAKAPFDWAKASQVAREVGLKVKKETWRNCFHVQLPRAR